MFTNISLCTDRRPHRVCSLSFYCRRSVETPGYETSCTIGHCL